MNFNANEVYSRQVEIIGEVGQIKLKESSVTLIGAGGLGSPALLYLTASGVGKLRIIDYQRIEQSNLNRQVLYSTEDVGRKKIRVAEERSRALNPLADVRGIDEHVDEENCAGLIGGSDLVVDCLDNWETRFVVNKACVKLGIKMVHGAVERMNGQLTTIIPGETPCLACLFRNREKKTPQVMGFSAGIVGVLEAAEAVKLLTGVGETLANELLLIDLMTCSFDFLRVKRAKRCSVCGGDDDQR